MVNVYDKPNCYFDYAISFAGIHREYAKAIASKFSPEQFFYDDNENIKHIFPGQNLDEVLKNIYMHAKK